MPVTKKTVRTPDEDRLHWVRACISFVQGIGLEVVTRDSGVRGFIEGVRVRAGVLHVGLDTVFPGDVLHEAAHLALIPLRFRHLADGDLRDVNKAMRNYVEAHGEGLMRHPEDPLCRAVLQADEQEAAAWQYAAALKVGLPDVWLFPDDAFEGNGKAVLQYLKLKRHMGINGLQAARWTLVRKNPHIDLPVYPELAHWLCPH